MAHGSKNGSGRGRPWNPARGESDEFRRLLEEQGKPRFRPLAAGERVEGTVIAITPSSVLVDIGQRSEGVIPLDEVRPDDLGRMRVGDRAEFLVSRVSGSGIELSWALAAHTLDLKRIEDARAAGIPVEGKVTGDNKGGFTVELGGARGFVPFSQMELGPARPAAEYLHHTFRFRILEVKGKEVVLSRAALLREEQERLRKEVLDRIEPGLEMEAEVVRVERFGLFVDVGGGLHALVPAGELSWSGRDEMLRTMEPGTRVRIKILEIDRQGPKPKISATMRQLTEDPWASAGERFAEGQVVRGTVTRLASFGAFLEIAPGIEGLLHVSEMSDKKQIKSPSEVVRVGQSLDVAITAVDAAARRISLSITAIPDPEIDPLVRAKFMQTTPAPEGDGILAQALRRALQKKKS